MRRAAWLLYRTFDAARPWIGALEFFGGLVCVALTLVGIMPPVGDKWWGRIVAAVAWLVLAQEGFSELRDHLEGEFEPDD